MTTNEDLSKQVFAMRDRIEKQREDRKCKARGCAKDMDRADHQLCIKHFNMLQSSHRKAIFDPASTGAIEAAIDYLEQLESRGME